MTERTVRAEVPDALGGQRIDRVVAMLTEVSRTEAARLVTVGAVTVDGQVSTRGADKLPAGTTIAIEVPEAEPEHAPTADAGVAFEVVHEDDDVIVVNKPPGLVVHPGAGHAAGTLVNGLLARHPEVAAVGDPARPGIVHRLDVGTSGLLLVARSAAAYASLVQQLSERTVDRRYRTLVWGHPESPRGLVDAPIGRSPKQATKMAVTERGKPARTRYEVEATYEVPVEVAQLVCHLETGRTHQIRVHLSAIGHPVVGDDRYRGDRASLECPRPFLHAEMVGFDHPVIGERLRFEAPLPADLRQVLDGLR